MIDTTRQAHVDPDIARDNSYLPSLPGIHTLPTISHQRSGRSACIPGDTPLYTLHHLPPHSPICFSSPSSPTGTPPPTQRISPLFHRNTSGSTASNTSALTYAPDCAFTRARCGCKWCWPAEHRGLHPGSRGSRRPTVCCCPRDERCCYVARGRSPTPGNSYRSFD